MKNRTAKKLVEIVNETNIDSLKLRYLSDEVWRNGFTKGYFRGYFTACITIGSLTAIFSAFYKKGQEDAKNAQKIERLKARMNSVLGSKTFDFDEYLKKNVEEFKKRSNNNYKKGENKNEEV